MADDKSKYDNALEEYQRSLKIPSADNPDDVADTVYAITEHAKKFYQNWYASGNKDRRYYKGDQLDERPAYKSQIVDNEMLAVVETMKPRVLDSIAESDILPVDDNDDVKGLSQRVLFAERECGFVRKKPLIVHDVLVEGGTHLKMNNDVSVYRTPPRRIVREPEAESFDEANYYVDQVLKTVGDMVWEYDKKVENLRPDTEELEGNKDAPQGPPRSGRSSNIILSAPPVDETSPVTKYVFDEYNADIKEAKRVLVLECWVRDRTLRDDDEPIYPYGRLIHVAVAADEDGEIVREDGHPRLMTLLDRPNPYKLLYKMTGRFPLVEILCNDTDDVWSQSVITPLIPLQDGLNDTWNQMITNMRLVNNAREIWSGMAGVKEKDITGQPGEQIILALGNPLGVNEAHTWIQIPPIVQHMLPVIAAIKDAIRNESGILDVTRGEKPGAVTAASAINLLQMKADNRILQKAERITYGFQQVKETLAYIAQEFDDEELLLPDESRDTEEKFTPYNPEDVRDKKIRVVGTRRKDVSEIIQMLLAIADIESKTGMGELVTMYDEDPRIHDLYIQMKQTREEKEQQMRQDEERQKQALAMSGQVMNIIGQQLTQKQQTEQKQPSK